MNKHLCNKMLSPLVVFLIMVMLELPYLFPQWLYKFAPPQAINKCCLSPQPHLNELQLILIGLGHSDWYKQRPQRSFDLHIFLLLLQVFFSNWCFILWEPSVYVCTPLSTGSLVLLMLGIFVCLFSTY